MLRFLNVIPQFLLPQHLLTAQMYRLTRIKNTAIKNFLIRQFIRLFSVDMQDYQRQAVNDYQHFNDFFTRELKPESREISTNDIVSPVDGFVSEFGFIKINTLIQAKGKDYKLDNLLAQDNALTDTYTNGEFITIYLSPKNYHRIHLPVDAKLTQLTFVPGKLYGVGNSTTQTINNLFTKNERLIFNFETSLGAMCLIMVGAIFVGSMQTIWHGEITPTKKRTIRKIDIPSDQERLLNKAQEIARFNMGSTVIMLFQKNAISWLEEITTGQAIKMGEGIANKKLTD